MKRFRLLPLALLIAVLPLFESATGPKAREATCYVLVEEGKSAEGNSLFLQRMGLNPQALSMVAPTRFSFAAGSSFSRAGGSFSYEGGQPILVDRKGRLALYSVAVKFWGEAFPKAFKTYTVDLSVADLAANADLVQPAEKAIEKAAAKAGVKSGLAWIIEMKMPTRGSIRVKVGLAR
jgi:hypothetical protein